MKYLVLKKNYFKNNRHKEVYFHDWCINEDWNELNEKLLNITVNVLPKKLDEEVAAGMVRGFGGVLTTMTDEQADYIGVSKVGPYKPEVYRY